MVLNRPVTLAVIIGAHGVAGEVRLKLFTDGVGSLKAHKTFNGGALTMTSVRPGTNGAIARFAEITDRNTVEAMRGTELAVPRDALPPLADGEYYHADLMGLPCVTTEGDTVGICVAVENFGATDVLEIERPDKKTFMVPMTPAAVPEWSDDRILIEASYCA
jgi:16S rRNA processing protein RimM